MTRQEARGGFPGGCTEPQPLAATSEMMCRGAHLREEMHLVPTKTPPKAASPRPGPVLRAPVQAWGPRRGGGKCV